MKCWQKVGVIEGPSILGVDKRLEQACQAHSRHFLQTISTALSVLVWTPPAALQPAVGGQ